MTETNPPAAFDPDHLPTVAEFDDMVDHNRAHGRVFSFAPAVIRELLDEVERLREELSQADTFGRGEFRVTTWAYEQAVRALGCAHERIRELEAAVPDTGQDHEHPAARMEQTRRTDMSDFPYTDEQLADMDLPDLDAAWDQHLNQCDTCNYDLENCPCEWVDEALGPNDHGCNCPHGGAGSRLQKAMIEARRTVWL